MLWRHTFNKNSVMAYTWCCWELCKDRKCRLREGRPRLIVSKNLAKSKGTKDVEIVEREEVPMFCPHLTHWINKKIMIFPYSHHEFSPPCVNKQVYELELQWIRFQVGGATETEMNDKKCWCLAFHGFIGSDWLPVNGCNKIIATENLTPNGRVVGKWSGSFRKI